MRVKIIRKTFGGVEFAPEMRVLHLGGQSSANVERLYFELPEEWQGLSVTLHIQRQDGTLPTPILLDEEQSCAVGKEFTASKCGSWMLLALGENGYRALTRPAKYDCYETLATDGDAEISPTQYETFVARVLAYANSAQDSAREARNSAAAAKQDAETAELARVNAVAAAGQAGTAQSAAESSADRAEAAAARAELTAPSDGAVRSVNGKGGVVTLTADDVGAVPEGSAGYVKSMSLVGQTLTLTFGDGSTQTMQTKDTTILENMTGILDAEHGGTGKNTPLTAADVGAAEAEKTAQELGKRYTKAEVDALLKAQQLKDHPVGSPFFTIKDDDPAQLFGGTWVKIAENRAIMGASDAHPAGSTAEAGLPNITGYTGHSATVASAEMTQWGYDGDTGGAFSKGESSNWYTGYTNTKYFQAHVLKLDASKSSPVYGASDTVQPPAYYFNIWLRVA